MPSQDLASRLTDFLSERPSAIPMRDWCMPSFLPSVGKLEFVRPKGRLRYKDTTHQQDFRNITFVTLSSSLTTFFIQFWPGNNTDESRELCLSAKCKYVLEPFDQHMDRIQECFHFGWNKLCYYRSGIFVSGTTIKCSALSSPTFQTWLVWTLDSGRTRDSFNKKRRESSFFLIFRLGNRSDRVSDFSLQKLRFSAPCGPN